MFLRRCINNFHRMNKEIQNADNHSERAAESGSSIENLHFTVEKLQAEIESSRHNNEKVQLKEMQSFYELIDLIIIESHANKDAIDEIVSCLKKFVSKEVLEQVIIETIKILVSKSEETGTNHERDEITRNVRRIASCTFRP